MKLRKSLSLLLFSVGILALACGGNGEKTVTHGQGGADLPPALEITSPDDGSKVSRGMLVVKVSVEHFKLVEMIGQPSVEGEGHILYTLDVPESGLPDDGRSIIETSQREAKFKNVAPGVHTVMAHLVASNGALLQPSVAQRITVTVE